MSTMDYKSYIAKITYDDETQSFQGVTINTKNAISFYGYSAEELKANFQQAIDNYLSYCAEKGIEPAKAFTGQLRVRFDPDLHAKISRAAMVTDQSLNNFIAQAAAARADKILGNQGAE